MSNKADETYNAFVKAINSLHAEGKLSSELPEMILTRYLEQAAKDQRPEQTEGANNNE